MYILHGKIFWNVDVYDLYSQGLVEVLVEDNLKQELSTVYRSSLEDELASKER